MPATEPREVLVAQRDEALAQIAALSRDFTALVDAAESSNADDEHDPEGATLAFERQQLAAVLDLARARLHEVERALVQVRDGSYGRCERCGDAIGAERLAARPAALACIACARTAPGA
ncbi:MAG TPA: TraR/DksA C4-type zinc finger protein [Mycobacteriales bacterium]|nr:TraR/DksA C4-type zinc finger protein [Mycobacteriales bacterium]